jgi:two-component system response regulator YesN
MYSILLIDDEKSIREYLPRAIDFEQYGFTVRDTAINGEEALQKLPSVCPDLILLDVRMPVMDGLQFLRQLRRDEFANTPVIMLSGYNEFEYAREAMKYGVKAYLNKPLDEDEMIPLLEKMREELDHYHSEKDLVSVRKHLKMLNLLYSGAAMDRRQFAGYTFMTCVILPCPQSIEAGNPHFLLQECLARHLGELENYEFRVKGSQYTFLLPVKLFQPFGNDKKAFADHLLKSLKDENLDCALLFDSYVFEHEERTFREDFSQHHYEMLTQLFFAPEKFADYCPGCLKMGEELHMEPAYLEEIKKHLLSLNRDGVQASFEKLTNEIAEIRLGIHLIQEINFRIYYLIVEEISGLSGSKQLEPFLSRPEWLDYPYFVSFERWKGMLLSLVMEGFAFIERCCRMSNLGISRDVIEYIHTHYQEQISLKQIADVFFMNAVYLGRVFQKATGVNFNQYVNRIRIAEAKKLLLQTDKLIYEIASEVGYTESKYFIVKFTQEVGKSPTEYRNQL